MQVLVKKQGDMRKTWKTVTIRVSLRAYSNTNACLPRFYIDMRFFRSCCSGCGFSPKPTNFRVVFKGSFIIIKGYLDIP